MRAELCAEDALRLRVLFAEELRAVRLEEATMSLHALTPRGEARIALHPSGRGDQYLARVREALGSHALNSPGGYPVYLARWTRMGQASDRNLAALLLLGEPEAVVAVANAPGLTEELARRAWWAQPTGEVARGILAHPGIARGPLGTILAGFLVEHLPFEEDPDAAADAIRMALASGALDEAGRRRLWQLAARNPHYLIGFIERGDEEFPVQRPARADHAAVAARVSALAQAGDPYAFQLLRSLSAPGQSFLAACAQVLEQPATHAVVYALLAAIGAWFAPARTEAADSFDAALEHAARCVAAAAEHEALGALRAAVPDLAPELRAMLALASLRPALAEPILTRTTAVGPLMRRKLAPLATPIAQCLAALGAPAAVAARGRTR